MNESLLDRIAFVSRKKRYGFQSNGWAAGPHRDVVGEWNTDIVDHFSEFQLPVKHHLIQWKFFRDVVSRDLQHNFDFLVGERNRIGTSKGDHQIHSAAAIL